jgi:ABC-type dipeptide/oligopeptide/nickel transport system permease component
MLAFIVRRLAQAVLVMLVVGLIAFSLFRFVGDPVTFMLGQDATPEQREQITRALGLDRPFYVQYASFLRNAVHGEFGLSLRQVRPVSQLIVERLPATLELKNTLVPVITITGLQLGAIIAFAIITETVFQWPGMGLLFIQAVSFADVPVMAAYLCLIALFFVIINLAVDLLYYAVDPRLRIEPR